MPEATTVLQKLVKAVILWPLYGIVFLLVFLPIAGAPCFMGLMLYYAWRVIYYLLVVPVRFVWQLGVRFHRSLSHA